MRSRIPYIKAICIFGCLLIGAVLIIVAFGLVENALDKAENHATLSDADSTSGQVLYESEWYVPKDDLESILILGLDKRLDGSEDRQSSEQADFFALVVLDKHEKSYKILFIKTFILMFL